MEKQKAEKLSESVVAQTDPSDAEKGLETDGEHELDEAELDEASGGLNVGSQSTGAGAGRVTFNPFSITRKLNK